MVVSNTMMGATAQSVTQAKHCGCEKNFCNVCRLPTCRPHRDAHWKEGTLNTTYRKDYNEKDNLHERVRKPNDLMPTLAAFDGRTTNKADYTPKKAATWSCRPANRPMPATSLSKETTYGHFHAGRKGLPLERRQLPPVAQSAPFQGLSTKQADFVDWGHQAKPYTPQPWNIPQLAFDGTSTYKDDFVKKQMPEPHLRPPPQLLPSQNLPNSSTYGTDFVEHPLHTTLNECCDNPHHPAHHVHMHLPASTLRGMAGKSLDTAQLLGNTTGRKYRL